MSLTANINIVQNIIHTKELDLNTAQDNMNRTVGPTFVDGTGANQANIFFHDTRNLLNAANETLALADGSLKDAFGDDFAADELKGLYIKNNSSDANLIVGAGGANSVGLFSDVTDAQVIKPGGEYFYSAPDASGLDVTTNADLKLTHSGGGSSSLDYDIVIIGVE